jgi:predicted DNA-binding transcriptional regulator YafY
VPVDEFLQELGISLTTFKRDMALLRDQMQAPIVWQRGDADNPRGYVLEDKGWSSGKLGLPRAWFTAAEIYALLMIDELAHHIGPGLLTEHLQPLITRITLAMSAADDAPQDIRSQVRIIASASKRRTAPHFESVAQAAVKRQQLRIVYFTRSRNERSERVVSPQCLIHYKENWYLIAWCHKSEGLRMFALDAIEDAHQTNETAVHVAVQQVDDLLGRDFGVYAGKDRQWAKLRFTPVQARWVEAEVWHPDQKSTLLDDGSYLLEVPYSDPRELMLEILRFGPDVQVLEPAELRNAVKDRLQKAAAQYTSKDSI